MTETFAQEVLRRRVALHLSQADLARMAGVSRNTIGNIERGRGRTEPLVMDRLRDSLDAAESCEPIALLSTVNVPGEAIARVFDALVEALAEELIPPDSTTVEAAAFRATRRAYQHAARIARGGLA